VLAIMINAYNVCPFEEYDSSAVSRALF